MKHDFLRQFFRPENQKSMVGIVSVFLLGIVLLFCSSHFFVQDTEQNKTEEVQEIHHTERAERQVEQEMEQILSQIEGAGAVRVMLTYSSTEQRVPATETKREESNRSGESHIGSEQKIVLIEERSGGQKPLILSEYAPVVEGVVIVAQGGGNAVVRDALHQAAQALLQVPSHKIAILKMK